MKANWIPVVAGALCAADGRWLMHRRPFEKHHGGLWEFPGGKVEPFENPVESLMRELHEELDIAIRAEDCEPIGFAEEHAKMASLRGDVPIVILLYKIERWDGKPVAMEGGKIDWFAPDEITLLDKPPLDVALAQRLFAMKE